MIEDNDIKKLLVEIVREAIHRSLSALEREKAINLDKLRTGYKNSHDNYYKLIHSQILYTCKYAPDDPEKIGQTIVWIMSDAFNRTMQELQKHKVIDRKKLDKEYHGVGSRYYDVVTEEMQSFIPVWIESLDHYKNTGNVVILCEHTGLE